VDGFPFSNVVRVRFAETDAQGIAHHASFVVWLEEARVAYLAAFAGGYRAIRERGIEALTTGVHVEYERAAVFDDVLTIHVRCGEIRAARFRYEYVVERDGERMATGWTTHATVDAETQRPTRVPAWFVEDVVRAEASAGRSPA
jgi:acyl-CoA thioester hydrolase